MSSTEALLSFHDMAYTYPGRVLFERVNVSFEAGQVVALLGPNGVGKTTLLRCCAQLLAPTQGYVKRQAAIAYVPQTSELNAPYTVEQVVAMGRSSHTALFGRVTSEDRQAISHAISDCHLDRLAQRIFPSLSGGERQRVLVARAVAQAAQIMVLDEPMAAMDLSHQVALLALLKHLASSQNKLVIFSTHQPQHALSIASHSVLMSHQHTLRFGPTSQILTEEGLMQCFGVPSKLIPIAVQESTKHYAVPLI